KNSSLHQRFDLKHSLIILHLLEGGQTGRHSQHHRKYEYNRNQPSASIHSITHSSSLVTSPRRTRRGEGCMQRSSIDERVSATIGRHAQPLAPAAGPRLQRPHPVTSADRS